MRVTPFHISFQPHFHKPYFIFIKRKWQQHLLNKYGNAIVLMDATNKTTKYELPVFFLGNRKINVDYTPIVDYIVQSETADKIAEAWRIIANWNSQWSPPHFMTDYFDAKITAIESVFPQSKVYLCDKYSLIVS